MAKYHINPQTGNEGLCRAEKGKCRFGGDESHFTSRDGARAAYEEQQRMNPSLKRVKAEYYVSSAENIISMLEENDWDGSSKDLALVKSHLDSAYSEGYSNGVDMEMGSGRGIEFDTLAAAKDLLQSLSSNFDYSKHPEVVTAIEECIERQWSSGTANGGWDS